MPLVALIGDAVQTRREMTVEWRIANPFSLSAKVDDYYESPVFSFAGSLWRLRLCPNGMSDDSEEAFSTDSDDSEEELSTDSDDSKEKLSTDSGGRGDDSEEKFSTDNGGRGDDSSTIWVGVYLCRQDWGPCKIIRYTFGIRCLYGVEMKDEEVGYFSAKCYLRGIDEFWSRAELRNDASRLIPDSVLKIICLLICSEPDAAKVSLGSRVQKVSRNMKTVLADGRRADFTLKLGGREWPVHKVILESRCQYFASMFRHDWVENTVGEVTFEDIEENALDIVLDFVYSGDVECMSVKNVSEIYVAAHKFLLDDLKAVCVEYMIVEMCLKIFCKALLIADTYGEKDLRQRAVEYFMLEKGRIFKSEEWKELKKNHGSVAAELLEEITKKREVVAHERLS